MQAIVTSLQVATQGIYEALASNFLNWGVY